MNPLAAERALIEFVALTRARPTRAACAALRLLVDVVIFVLAKLLLADSGSGPTMELRRSMLTSASLGRGVGDGAAPTERSEVWGHDNRSENLQHLQRTASTLLAALSRAREAREFSSEL